MKQRVLAWVIGVSQLALGAGFLLIPDLFFGAFGFTLATPDQKYLYGQLAARFIAYGIGMFVIARDVEVNRPWWMLMALIQAIDLGVGLFYTVFRSVPLGASGFPMFNAAVFLALLLVWAPKKRNAGPA
jgi:hypothetical protein